MKHAKVPAFPAATVGPCQTEFAGDLTLHSESSTLFRRSPFFYFLVKLEMLLVFFIWGQEEMTIVWGQRKCGGVYLRRTETWWFRLSIMCLLVPYVSGSYRKYESPPELNRFFKNIMTLINYLIHIYRSKRQRIHTLDVSKYMPNPRAFICKLCLELERRSSMRRKSVSRTVSPVPLFLGVTQRH
jgi:hypothetical protein